MAVNHAVKKNNSSLQVLKTLKVLLEDDYTMNEIVDNLNANEKKPIFNNSVVSKYINTCRYCGIQIPKIHNKYFVAGLPFGLNLTLKDLDLLDTLQTTAVKFLSAKTVREFGKLIQKLNKFSNKQIVRCEKTDVEMSHHVFEQSISEKRMISLMLKNNKVLECIPLKIIENNNKLYFEVFFEDEEKLILTDNVIAFKKLNKQFVLNNKETTVLFRLKGNLAKRYTLREHEHLEYNNEPDSIVVVNKGENKEFLFSRLLRYDTCCEIISPKHYRDEMKQLINNMLANYGE